MIATALLLAALSSDLALTCTVRIRLFDDRSGAPVASKVELWRLDAPGPREVPREVPGSNAAAATRDDCRKN